MTQLTPEQMAEIMSFANEHDNFNHSPATAAEHMDALLSHVSALTAEIAALRRDAEKRREALMLARPYMAINVYCSTEDEDHFRMACEMVDAAIDSAMSPKVLPEREG